MFGSVVPVGVAGVDGSSTPVVSSQSVKPSPSVSVVIKPIGSHGSSGSVPFITSVPLSIPSPSQSAAFQAAFGARFCDDNTKLQLSFGSVPSAASMKSATPSPSVSVPQSTGSPPVSNASIAPTHTPESHEPSPISPIAILKW